MSENTGHILRQELQDIASDAEKAFKKIVAMDSFADFSGPRRLFTRFERAVRPLLPRLATDGFVDAHRAAEAQLEQVHTFARIDDIDEEDGDANEGIAALWNDAEAVLYRLRKAVLPILPESSSRLTVPKALMEAYESTRFVIDPNGDESVLLEVSVGHRNPELELLLEDQGLRNRPLDTHYRVQPTVEGALKH